jgi:hypothetical protein
MFNTLVRTMERAPVTNPASFKARFLTGGEMTRYVELGSVGTSFNIRAIRWTTVTKSTLAAPVDWLGAWGLGLGVGWLLCPRVWRDGVDRNGSFPVLDVRHLSGVEAR